MSERRVSTEEVLSKVVSEFKVIKGKESINRVIEFAVLFDASNSNPNGSFPENMPREIPGTGQIYVTQESYKKRGKDALRNVLEDKGLYEEQPRGEIFDKVTMWVSGRAVDPTIRFEEIVGTGVSVKKGKNKVKVDKMEEWAMPYFLSSAIDAISFGAVVPVMGNINLTGPIQVIDAVSVHPVEIIPEGGTAAFTTGEEKGQRSTRQEYKVGYALLSGGGVFLPGYLNDSVFSSESESVRGIKIRNFFTAHHLEVWIRAIWTGFATQYMTTSKNIRPVALIVAEYDGWYIKHFLARKMQEILWSMLKDRKPAGITDISDEIIGTVERIKSDIPDVRIWTMKSVIDIPGADDGEEIILR